MRTVIRRIAAAIAASSLLLVGLVATTPASAAVTWVSGLSWTNLRVLQEDGVFEKYRREFDVNSVLQLAALAGRGPLLAQPEPRRARARMRPHRGGGESGRRPYNNAAAA